MSGLRRHPHLVAWVAYVALALAIVWPLWAHFTTVAMGDRAQAFRTVWGYWWWRQALFSPGGGPSALLRWPPGAPLALPSWDAPAALSLLPCWSLVPSIGAIALYNLAAVSALPLTAFFTYVLCRELWGGWWGPWVAGALLAALAWRFACAPAGMSLVSAQWIPLYFYGLVRTVRWRGVWGPLLGGSGLALAALASPIHLALCALGTVVLAVGWAWRDGVVRVDVWAKRRALFLLGLFALLAGGALIAMLRAGAGRELANGAVNAPPAALDLASVMLSVPEHVRQALGREGAHGGVGGMIGLGWISLALAIVAGFRSRAARPWLGVAIAGEVLALGARPYWAGVPLTRAPLPWGWLLRAVPGLTGVNPAPFAWLACFGVAVVAALTLGEVARRGRRGVMWAAVLSGAALIELWPGAQPLDPWPAPRFLSDLARDGERWAILDASEPARALWNQVLHGHPVIGGHLARTPERLDPFLLEVPVLRPFFGDDTAGLSRSQAIDALQDLQIRLVVVDASRLASARALELPLAYQGDGVWVFEVPARGKL